jgi:hypothetical protein
MKTTILFLLLVAPALAADQHLKNGITVYQAVVSKSLPADAYEMTTEQYANWAYHHNQQALYANQQAAFAKSDHVRYAYVTETAGWQQTRFGGGVGYGGYGGSGGYAGYADTQSNGSTGFQYGAGRSGNSQQSQYGSTVKSYSLEFHDWPTFNGGDVELLNPFCKPRKGD